MRLGYSYIATQMFLSLNIFSKGLVNMFVQCLHCNELGKIMVGILRNLPLSSLSLAINPLQMCKSGCKELISSFLPYSKVQRPINKSRMIDYFISRGKIPHILCSYSIFLKVLQSNNIIEKFFKFIYVPGEKKIYGKFWKSIFSTLTNFSDVNEIIFLCQSLTFYYFMKYALGNTH